VSAGLATSGICAGTLREVHALARAQLTQRSRQHSLCLLFVSFSPSVMESARWQSGILAAVARASRTCSAAHPQEGGRRSRHTLDNFGQPDASARGQERRSSDLTHSTFRRSA
jgi:hypothetical protein